MNIIQRYYYRKEKAILKHTYRFVEQPYNTLVAYEGNTAKYIFRFKDGELIEAQAKSIQHHNKWLDVTIALWHTDIIMRELAIEYKANEYNLDHILKGKLA